MAAAFPILLIDDDTSLLKTLRQASGVAFPEALFSQITRVNEAKTYIASLDGILPKLVLLNINFPEPPSGFDILDCFRTSPKSITLPIITLTTSHSSGDVIAAYSKGASSFMIKPSTYEEWEKYLRILRTYWLQTVTLPPSRN